MTRAPKCPDPEKLTVYNHILLDILRTCGAFQKIYRHRYSWAGYETFKVLNGKNRKKKKKTQSKMEETSGRAREEVSETSIIY